jgi:hypothetical protein
MMRDAFNKIGARLLKGELLYWIAALSHTTPRRNTSAGRWLLNALAANGVLALQWRRRRRPAAIHALMLSILCFLVSLPVSAFCVDWVFGDPFRFPRWCPEPAALAMLLALSLLTSYIFSRAMYTRLQWKLVKVEHRYCIVCGYDLNGNVSGVCSECGTPWLGEGALLRENVGLHAAAGITSVATTKPGCVLRWAAGLLFLVSTLLLVAGLGSWYLGISLLIAEYMILGAALVLVLSSLCLLIWGQGLIVRTVASLPMLFVLLLIVVVPQVLYPRDRNEPICLRNALAAVLVCWACMFVACGLTLKFAADRGQSNCLPSGTLTTCRRVAGWFRRTKPHAVRS